MKDFKVTISAKAALEIHRLLNALSNICWDNMKGINAPMSAQQIVDSIRDKVPPCKREIKQLKLTDDNKWFWEEMEKHRVK